jgi:hypothetical protein
MRQPRLKPKGITNVFHCLSRAAGGQAIFGPVEKEWFRKLMWFHAAFCQVQIITHTVMSNHFHLVVRTPARVKLSNPKLLAALQAFYGPKSHQATQFQGAMKGIRKNKNKKSRLQKLRRKYLRRMGDVSAFMKELKQAFSRWYNKRHDRYGTLWAERFTSLLVQDRSLAVWVVAAYVDLNGLRAHQVKDPKDYRWCGYAEAVAGHRRAREGLLSLVEPGASWKSFQSLYRKYLFAEAGQSRRAGKAQLSREEVLKVMEQGGQLSIAQLLRLRVRYFTNGVVLGTQEYVDKIWKKYRKKCSPKRKSGGRKMKGGAAWGELRTMRDLQKDGMG